MDPSPMSPQEPLAAHGLRATRQRCVLADMLYRLAQATDRLIGVDTADAHCDIPCKIYDPAPALIAALSVVRMVDILTETAD